MTTAPITNADRRRRGPIRTLDLGLAAAAAAKSARRKLPCACLVCGGPTRHQKPWCTEHVARSPEAARIAHELDDLAADVAMIQSGGRPDTGGPFAREVLRILLVEGGGATAGKCSRALGVAPALVEAVFLELERLGAVEVEQRPRSVVAVVVAR